MATRLLPNVYGYLNDLSQLPEGATSLNVGFVLKANRGPVNEWGLVTSPTDFLTKYTFSGQPKQTDDPTMHTIIKVLAQTNTMYVVRAANNPLYGGVIIKKAKDYGTVIKVSKDDETIEINGDEVPEIGELVMITGSNIVDGYYIVKEVNGKVITVTGDILEDYGKLADVISIEESAKTFIVPNDISALLKEGNLISVKFTKEDITTIKNYTVSSVNYSKDSDISTIVVKESVKIPESDEQLFDCKGIFRYGQAEGSSLLREPVVPLANVKIGEIYSVDLEENAFVLDGYKGNVLAVGDVITVKGSTESGYANNDGDYTVVSKHPKEDDPNKIVVVVEETIAEASGGAVYFNSLVNPEGYVTFFGEDDLMLITGIDQGAYNGQLAFTILSSVDNPDSLVYHKGARGIFDKPCTFDTMQLGVVNTETNEPVESFLFSRDPDAKAIDGSLLFVDDIVNGSSAYIKVVNNPNNVDMPNSTLSGVPIQASGGSDGEPVTAGDLAAALDVFSDKTIPVSILGNGCSPEAESEVFQQALINLAVTRKDIFVFLNSRKVDEKATLPSTRAQNIVAYKKDLGNTSFYGCMYAPHVKTPDVFNSREVEIGTDGVAIAGWLNVINSLNYPYAYAGPRNGLVSGVTSNWKIGDMSGEAEILNDASVNYVAYDGKVGRYYMQCQNTLQVANSAMRNIGVVLNVLDIKETLMTDLKEYLQLPITDDLRRDILDTVNDYLSPMVGVRFYNYAFQDVTTDTDIANDTLRYLLTLSPTRYSRLIYLSMNIVASNFNFAILQSA